MYKEKTSSVLLPSLIAISIVVWLFYRVQSFLEGVPFPLWFVVAIVENISKQERFKRDVTMTER